MVCGYRFCRASRLQESHRSMYDTRQWYIVFYFNTKQRLNSRSSTEAKFIVDDDVIGKILWTKLFLEYQGVNVKMNIIYQGNESSVKKEMNGKTSSGKRTRNYEIKYYYITDLVN
jgi:hypothetical protein